jgi:hypothetical protein
MVMWHDIQCVCWVQFSLHGSWNCWPFNTRLSRHTFPSVCMQFPGHVTCDLRKLGLNLKNSLWLLILVLIIESIPVAVRSAAVRLLGLRVQIPRDAWMSVSWECCVLSGRGLCVGPIARPEESYRMWCVFVSHCVWQGVRITLYT